MDNWTMNKSYWSSDADVSNSAVPPPKFNNGSTTNSNPGLPVIETHNHLTFPEGPKCQFLAGEGTYVLKEELRLACPPPHPTEATSQNPNPLATTKLPPTSGTKVSLVSFDPNATHKLSKTNSANGRPASITEHAGEDHLPEDGSTVNGNGTLGSDDGLGTSISDVPSTTPTFREGNALLAAQTGNRDGNKRKKPKSNISKSNSSFISRAIVPDGLNKKIHEHDPNGHYAFVNLNRSFQWLDLSSPNKAEYFTKILFTKGHCLTHDVNQVTKTHNHIDVIMGFNTGEIIWWEPFSQRYTRINKNGIICNFPVQSIKWIPGSENLFIAGHANGAIIVYDKEKDDAPVNRNTEPIMSTQDFGMLRSRIRVEKSVFSKNQKTNPVSWWRPNCSGIKELAFSPDNKYLAVVSSNMVFRLLDYVHEKQEDMFCSWFGEFTCVSWSPDGKYLVTGSQDDQLTIWSMADKSPVAWCKGHKSWPSAVAFDPWRCDARNYRFGSVGEDCRLLLWDFNAGMLVKPKTPGSNTRRASVVSTPAGQKSEHIIHENGTAEHGPAHQLDTPSLIPVCSHEADASILTGLVFTEEAIITSSKAGLVRTWLRPAKPSI